ncbi:T9SS type A sorting domain-containing protein [Winogradskyella sp. F6397]|uniref:T9SS type A sorting domain-containing protein n=1 Tax=Winogradskyella marina TaxID=2785530 RepID=A0ABS0ELW5_9FLAO|nr:PKD-like domain-containing protein [Winogradskyella marina]MBF8150567.1 T9SS type A sorting domain-containing protein [Winogradskyella marina]
MKNYYLNFLTIITAALFLTNSYGQDVNTSVAGANTSTAPAGAISATVEIWGAGGGGGGSTQNSREGSGGGGGGYTTLEFAVNPGDDIIYTVGAGGDSSTGNGTAGGDSTLIHANATLTANGGNGGNSNNNSNTSGGGAGGNATGGTINTTGQNGEHNGGNGTGGDGGDGANGGAGGNGSRNGEGTPGNPPGGGGGGGEARRGFFGTTSYAGGRGANGRVIITYTIALPADITTINPGWTCVDSGASIVVSGTNFTGATDFYFNGTPAVFTVDSDTQITATFPNGATSGPLSVTTPAGTFVDGSLFIVKTHPTAPTGISGSTTICNGNSTTLTRSGGSLGMYATAEWYSGTCGGTYLGTGGSITVSPTTDTTYFVRYEGDCSTTTCAQVTVTVENPVAAAGTIAGTPTVCQGQTGVAYSVPAIANATSYNWSLPTGATIASGAGTRNITVNFSASATSGNITVVGNNSCGNGTASSYPVTVNNLPNSPGSVSGTDTVCQGDTGVSFSIPPIANATSYNWTLPLGATIASGANTESITVDFSATSVSGSIEVYGINACGASPSAFYPVTINRLSIAPTSISGASTICEGVSTTLFANGGTIGTGASTEWYTGSCGGTFIGTGSQITVSPTTDTTYYVRYEGTCNTTTCTSVTVTVNPLPIAAGAISGTNTVCQGETGVAFSVPAITNATSYTWSVPTGATIASGAGTNSITVDFGTSAISGNVSVQGTNTCGNGASSDFGVTINPLPDAAGSITGSAIVCQGDTGVSFSVPTIANATGYTWTLPTGATIVSGSNTENITVDFSSIATSGTITVSGTNACGSGVISANYNVTVNIPSEMPTSILGTSTICETDSTTLTLDGGLAGTGATAEWFSGSCGGTAEGTGNSITVSPIVTTEYFVRYTGDCNTTSCQSIIVTVDPLPVSAGTISGPSEVCQAESGVTYSVPAIANATGYIWTLPTGATIVGGANTNSIIVDFDVTASSGNITVQGSNACGVGAISTLPITVNITPFIAINYTTTTCSEGLASVSPANGGGNIVPPGTTYSWGLPSVTGGLTGATVETGQANFSQTLINPTNSPQTASYNVTATTGGCSASTFVVVVTVNPKPIIDATSTSQTICPGESITPIVFSETSGVTGTIDYNWTRDNTANVTGMTANGSGASLSGNLSNSTNTAQTTTFTVTGTSQNGCTSDPITISVTVDPTPTVAATPSTQDICSGDTFTDIVISNPNAVAGTLTYSWTRTNDSNVTGIPNSGTGIALATPISGGLTNTTNSPQTTVFTITAYANGCESATTTASITVNPTPTVAASIVSQTVCGGDSISPIVITNPNNVSGTVFSWTRNNTTNLTGIPNSGSGSPISGTFTNHTNVNQTTTFTITATANGCSSTTIATVTVKPTPQIVATPTAQTICDNTAITNINLSNSNNFPGTTYSWTRDNTSNIKGIASSGTNTTIISGTLQNETTSTQITTFTITATAPNGCSTTTTAEVTVYAPLTAPVIGNPQTVCLFSTPGQFTMTTPSTGGSGTNTYQWQSSLNDSGPWFDIAGATSTTYTPPFTDTDTPNTYYRLIIANVCGSVISNTIFIEVVGDLGFTFDFDDEFLLCPDEEFEPEISSIHLPTSRVRYTWVADPNYIDPPSGGPIGNTTFLFLASISDADIGPLTTINNTNSTITTQVEITPNVYNVFNGDFICSVTPQYVDVTIRPTPIATADAPFSTICSGTSADIEVDGNITDANMQFSWTRDNTGNVLGPPSGNSGNINTPTNSYTIANNLVNNTGTIQNVTYTITPTSNGCTGTPITIVIAVAPTVNPGDFETDQTLCSGENPVAFTQTTAATGLNLSYQWQNSTISAIGPWTDISGATAPTYDAPAITQTTWYQRVVTSTVNGVTCNAVNSTPIQVTINEIDSGSIAGDQTICDGGTPSVLSSTTNATGGGTISYQWQRNTTGCGGTWVSISGATSETYNPPAGLTNTTYYQRVATSTLNGESCTDVSNCVVVNVNKVTGGEIGNDQVICGDNPDAFTVITPATGTGTLSYQWQISTTGTSGPWTDIPSANGATYNPPSGLEETSYYQRITISTLNGEACEAVSDNAVTVIVNSLTAGTILENRTVCSGGDPVAFTESTPATGTGITYQWQSSTTSGAGPWINIGGATSATYNVPGGVTTTTYYQRVVTATVNGTGCEATSNFLVVFVNDISPSTIAGNQTICSTEDPTAFTVTTPASGSGTLSYQWQSAPSASGPWTNINLATSATYDPPVLSDTTFYQVITTSTLNGVACSEISNTVAKTVIPFIDAVASNLTTITSCNDTTIQLQGNETGTWSAVSIPSGNAYSFSDITNPNATFTGESGASYEITWTMDNAAPCAQDTAIIENIDFPLCGDFIDFDGTSNSNVNFGDAYDISGNFSFEIWVKPNAINGSIQTILSKRDTGDMTTGYDLRLVNGTISFNANNSTSVSANGITADRWYHIAVTYDGTYTLYVDGIERADVTATGPTSNGSDMLLGAMAHATSTPTNYYNGWMDEVRIWNTALSADQIRTMMNQEIENNGGVIGSVTGQQVTTGLNWSDLDGYYQMNQGTHISLGFLNANVGTNGQLMNMTTSQAETAPLPYISRANGNWDTPSTWLNNDVQMLPNTGGIDWNIVRIGHNVASGNRSTTLLGLVVDTNTYTINNNQELNVSKYLKIDGTLDLEGESQLIQPTGSIVDYTGTGYLERDQQGTSNTFSYNYWGSPVTSGINGGLRTYRLYDILYDGDQRVNWIGGHNGAPGNPVSITRRWIYSFSEELGDEMSDWKLEGETGIINSGLGFIMKGPGPGNASGTHNYSFRGLPHNGDITATVTENSPDLNQTLVGNPYPSAIDANEFIRDNIPNNVDTPNPGTTGSIDGSLYFWRQASTNNTHIFADYQGGYATYNLSGGIAAVASPGIGAVGDASSIIPHRYIPVAQGFFVNAASGQDSNIVKFKNSQRLFKTEASGESLFYRPSNSEHDNISVSTEEESIIRRVRINFTTPEGAVRPLLLAFTSDNEATDSFDYGFDALNSEAHPSDLSFLIEGERYVIQGVGEFDDTKEYPLDMVIAENGNVEIGLTELENFDEAIDVYIFDAVEGTYTRFNEVNFQINIDAGTYSDRFYLVFQEDAVLSTIEEEFKDITVRYLHDTDEIFVKTPPSVEVKQLYLINVAGQTIASWNATNLPMSNEIKIPVKHISEGTYILKAETNSSVFNKKIIIKY